MRSSKLKLGDSITIKLVGNIESIKVTNNKVVGYLVRLPDGTQTFVTTEEVIE